MRRDIVTAAAGTRANAPQPLKHRNNGNAKNITEPVDNSKSAIIARIDRARFTERTWEGARRLDRNPPKFLSEQDSDKARDRLAFRRGQAILDSLPERLVLGLTRREVRDIIHVLGEAHLSRSRRLREQERRALRGAQ